MICALAMKSLSGICLAGLLPSDSLIQHSHGSVSVQMEGARKDSSGAASAVPQVIRRQSRGSQALQLARSLGSAGALAMCLSSLFHSFDSLILFIASEYLMYLSNEPQRKVFQHQIDCKNIWQLRSNAAFAAQCQHCIYASMGQLSKCHQDSPAVLTQS